MTWQHHPSASGTGFELCDLGAIGEGFEFGEEDKPFRMFVLRQGSKVRAYVNARAHFGVPLDPGKDPTSVTAANSRIMCQVHYAKYAIDDGRCLEGECDGKGLEPIPVVVRNGVVIIGE